MKEENEEEKRDEKVEGEEKKQKEKRVEEAVKKKEKKNEDAEQNQKKADKENIDKPMGFWKKMWNSITKIEKYPDMAAEGLGKAISYISKVVAILAIVICLGTIYQTYQMIQEGVNYLQNEFPDFSYKDGILDIQAEETINISEEDSVVGQTIIDTKTEDEQIINQYIKELEQTGSGIIVLKDKVVLKNGSVAGTINYNYEEMFGQMGLNEFNKQDVINYANSSKIINLYVSIFLTIFIYSFIMYLLTTLSNAVLLSAFGYLTTWIARIRMRYVAVFNMSVYALTLSTILNMIYIAVNIFITFNMEYFQVMYVAVAAIYLVAAIFILKSEFIKKQAELMKIAEAQAIVRKELEEEEEERKRQEEKEKRKKKDKEEEDKQKKEKEEKNNDVGSEPEGSNA